MSCSVWTGDIELVPKEGVRLGSIFSVVSFDPELDLRRRLPPLMTLLNRLAVGFDPLDPSESELEDDDESSEDVSIH